MRRLTILLGAMLLGLTFVEPLRAQPNTDKPGVSQSSPFDRWDQNQDDRLTRDELPKPLRPNFDRVDADRDGFISREEDARFRSQANNRRRNSGGTDRESKAQRNSEALKGVRGLKEIAYVKDGHERQKLDLYLPESAGNPKPLVIWIHGGAWRAGSKNGGPFRPLLKRGFIVASINYRLSQHAIFPAQLHDCKAAIRWLRANAGTYGIDPGRIGVWGSSAGGHLVAMVGTTGDVQELEGDLGNGKFSSRVQAVCDWFGPTDFLLMNKQAGELGRMDHDAPDSPESKLIGAPIQDNPKKARKASPLPYVSADDPTFFIVHGDKDGLVAVDQSRLLQTAFEMAGVKSELRIVKGAGHGQFKDPDVVESSFRFFEKALRAPAGTEQEHSN